MLHALAKHAILSKDTEFLKDLDITPNYKQLIKVYYNLFYGIEEDCPEIILEGKIIPPLLTESYKIERLRCAKNLLR